MTWYACASSVMPRNIVIDSTAIISIVAAAFFDSGGWNAGTPFETASTPVIAVQPFENAVSSRNSVSGCAVGLDRRRQRPPARSLPVQRRAIAPTPMSASDRDDEEVGRHGEDAPGFADAAQVADHQERDETRASARRG